jgi:hypothetical protein
MDPLLATIADKVIDQLAGHALAELQRDRLVNARNTLARRIRSGSLSSVSDADKASGLFTYLRAAQEGCARRNLDLMAQALDSLLHERVFEPDEFRRHASRLADLSPQEILLLAALAIETDFALEEKERGKAWEAVSNKLKNTHNFRDLEEVVMWATALQRTGYLAPWPQMAGMVFTPTRLFQDMRRLVDFSNDEVL